MYSWTSPAGKGTHWVRHCPGRNPKSQSYNCVFLVRIPLIVNQRGGKKPTQQAQAHLHVGKPKPTWLLNTKSGKQSKVLPHLGSNPIWGEAM